MAYTYKGNKPDVGATQAQRQAGEFSPRARKPVLPCGTDAAYRRHLYHKETPCAPCAAEHKRFTAEYNAAYAAMTPEERAAVNAAKHPLSPCGARSAYARHQSRGEPIDDACREARCEYQNDVRARKREAARSPADWHPCECGHAWATHTTKDGCRYGTRASNPEQPCHCNAPPLLIGESK